MNGFLGELQKLKVNFVVVPPQGLLGWTLSRSRQVQPIIYCEKQAQKVAMKLRKRLLASVPF